MSGTLELTEQLCWMPPGWIFDRVLEQMSKHVSGDRQQRLLSSLTDMNGGYLDMREVPIAEVSKAFDAIAKILASTRVSGPSAMHEPSFYDGYVEQLEILESMFRQRIDMEKCQ